MRSTRNLFRLTLGLACIVALLIAIQAATPAAALAPDGFTPTPTESPTPTFMTVVPPPPPSATPTATLVSPTSTDPGSPEPPKRTKTPVPALPNTGEAPPDQGIMGWGGTLMAGVLAAALGLAGGFLLRVENRQKLLAWLERQNRER